MTKKVIKNEGFFKIVGQIEQKEIPRFVKSCLLACRVGASTYSEWKNGKNRILEKHYDFLCETLSEFLNREVSVAECFEAELVEAQLVN